MIFMWNDWDNNVGGILFKFFSVYWDLFEY